MDCEPSFNCAINLSKNVTIESGNLKNELKKYILTAIYTLNQECNRYKTQISVLNQKLQATNNPFGQKVSYVKL